MSIPELPSDDGYDRYASFYTRDHEKLDGFDMHLLKKHLRDLHGKRILDLGCGTGRLVPLFRRRNADRVVGLDLSQPMLDEAEKSGFYEDLYKSDVREGLPFDWESFDVIVTTMLIVHIPERELSDFFVECERVLVSGGQLLVVNIHQERPPVLATKAEKFVITSYVHRDKAVQKHIEDAGLEIEAIDREVDATLFVARKG